MATSARNRGATVAQLRDDIDRGRTGDKVAFPDPAIAPLGVDAEAAGTPPSPLLAERERIAERQNGGRTPGSAGNSLTWPMILLVVAIVAVLLGGVLAAVLTRW